MLQGDTAGDYTSAATCPCHEQQQNTELAHPGCGNLCPRMDFAVPVGAEAVRFSEDTRCCVGRAEVAEAGSTGAWAQHTK